VALSANQLRNGNSEPPDIITGFRVSRTAKERISGVLLDSGSSERPGGTGRILHWTEVGPMVEIIRQAGLNLFVAGGLTATNVGEAIRVLRPSGVDVASGVEASPGKKDPDKVRAFVRAVRELDRRVG
jgi:phosphoribosylanthranilate isomerase